MLILNTTSLTINGGGSFSGLITDFGANGTLTLNAPLVTDGVQLAARDASTPAKQIRTNGSSTGTSKVNTLNILGSTGNWSTGLDLTNNKLIVQDAVTKAATIARLQNQAQYGATHSAGIFTSAGLPANMAIAVVDNAAAGLNTFGGLPVNASSILVGARRLLGDANIDGQIDLTDLSTVLNNFGSSTTAWTSSNFDGQPTIDLTDLSYVLNNFGATNPNPSLGTGQIAAAPEPASLAIAIPAVLLAARKRRTRSQ